MVLKLKLSKDEHGKLPAQLQSEYKPQADGSFIVDWEGVDGLVVEDVTGLKSALGAERTRAKELEKLAERFKDLDPQAARDALAKVAEMANWKSDDKVKAQIEAITQQLANKHQSELANVTSENRALLEQLTDALADQAAKAAIKAAGATDTGAELLFPKVKARIRVEKNSAGKLSAIVIDEKGNPQITNRSGSQDAMGIGELVETFKKPYAICFAGTGTTGSGAPGKGSGGQGGSNTNVDSTLDPVEQLKQVRNGTGGQKP